MAGCTGGLETLELLGQGPISVGARLATMARRRSITSLLFRAARRVDDLEVLASGNPKRIERRAKNRLLGRALGRAGFWRWLWK
jgi:hypothetical protein